MLRWSGIYRAGVVMLLASVSLYSAHAALMGNRKTVLLVYHTNGAIPSNMAFEQVLAEDLRQKFGPALDFYREQLDSDRFPSQMAEKISSLRAKYAGIKIDAVIYSGNVPIKIVAEAPVVQIDNGLPEQTLQRVYGNNVVHVRFDIDPLKIIQIARRLQPHARKVLLISGSSDADRIYLEQFHHRLATSTDLAIETIDSASVPELVSLVSHLPQDVIVLPISYFRDPQGQSYVPREVLGKLAAASTVPLYAVSDTYVGKGLLGGYVVSWVKTGHVTADAASQLLEGTPAHEVTLRSSGTGVYIFDWRQLRRWGFSERNLPPESVVEYKSVSVWEQYRWRIVLVAVVIVLQSLSIVALCIHRYKRKQAETSLRDMTGRLLQSQDDERRRIARDLHDGTGQQLAGIALSVGQVLADFPQGHDRMRQLLQDSHRATREALDEVRAVSYALHPPILDGVGLLPALQWYLDGLQKRTDFSIDLDISETRVRTPPEVERTLFRIVQESVANALRHSDGSTLKVKLYDCLNGIHLLVEDNGRGMDIKRSQELDSPVSIGVGIAGMKERIRQFNGTITIDSTGSGTRVLVFVPLR